MLRIQHARNGDEKVIGPYRGDGYYETGDQKVVLEFHGDFWHGNPKLYSSSTVNPVNKLTVELYQNTLTKQKYIEEIGYTYVSIWESEFEKELKENNEMRTFIEQLDMVTPLQPREAFSGGRTEAFTLYKEATDDETIDYYDVTSLYPFINKTGKIPLGHPKIITENFAEIDKYEGLIKFKVIPPRELFIPVLPCKMNGKLLFSLCKICAESYQQTKCLHTNEESAFIGTWVTDEVKKAMDKGYTLYCVYEVWHFENVSQYDPVVKEGGLFTEYVNQFLKIKQEKSGWPKWCKAEEQKQIYIEHYYEKRGPA
ncbi:uncharacterized protein LOC128553199 [Mercenaria mercenaria]|uniref:uncharacterized protein LOC128553199 n=1 Tax=Mercenaria mercenaria TaxID=6596 RepID=UPI00234F9219|nr:uncharacterized protein LOC128553199 [Mercenaria mercenaria]